MEKAVIHPGYFFPIDLFAVYVNAEEILLENHDNYQKQTYRNRQYIYGANGKLLLNIPIDNTERRKGKEKYKEVKIENDYSWQRTHWRSLKSAYLSSPFFEFYQDDLQELYEKKFTYLIDFNHACRSVLNACLQIDKSEKFTTEFSTVYQDHIFDARELIKAKRKSAVDLPVYDQVFQEKHGFISNLSVLDLLFNKGPESLSYLSKLQFSISKPSI